MDETDDRSEVVPFDADTAFRVAERAATGEIYSFAVYTPADYRILHISDGISSFYRDEAQMYDHFEEIHSYVHVDFAERELFENHLFPGVGSVRTFVTRMDSMSFVRVLTGDCGAFFSTDRDERVGAVARAVEGVIIG